MSSTCAPSWPAVVVANSVRLWIDIRGPGNGSAEKQVRQQNRAKRNRLAQHQAPLKDKPFWLGRAWDWNADRAGKPVVDADNRHVTLFGPTRSDKGASIEIPDLLWGGDYRLMRLAGLRVPSGRAHSARGVPGSPSRAQRTQVAGPRARQPRLVAIQRFRSARLAGRTSQSKLRGQMCDRGGMRFFGHREASEVVARLQQCRQHQAAPHRRGLLLDRPTLGPAAILNITRPAKPARAAPFRDQSNH